MGVTIQQAPLLEQISGIEKIPISDDSGLPKAVTTEQLKTYIDVPSKTSELTNDSGFLTEHLDISHLATQSLVPTKVSLLENDSNYVLEDILTSEFSIKAISATGELLDLDLADTSCVAVAYRGESCSFIIAKHDVLNSSKFYWGKNLKGYDIPNLANFSSMSSLLNDFNGSLNTKAIISSYDYFGVEMNDSDMCKGFETYKETYTDWYIPTASQLLLLFYCINEINEMLNKIGGTPLSTTDYYWSSTEHSANQAWVAKLTNGKVLFNFDKDTLRLLRLVRDAKTIKLRISNLETRVTELENIPEPDLTEYATKEELKTYIDTELSELDSKIENIAPGTGVDAGNASIFNSESRTEWINQWIDDDGSGRQVSPSARAYFFQVKGIKKLRLSLSSLSGSKSYYHYVFFNSEEPGTSSIMAEYSAKENSSEFVGDVEVPEGAVLIGVNVRTDLGYDNDVVICDYGYILEQSVKTADDVKQMKDDLSFFGYNKRLEWINSWIGSDGGRVQIQQTARAYFYKVMVGDMIRLSLSAISGSMGSSYYHYAFYNSDQPSANSLMADYSYIRDRNKDLNTTVEVPEGAVLIGISVFTDLPNSISFESGNKLLELSKDVKELKKDTESIGNDVSELKTSISGLNNVDIADTLSWTNGSWNFTNNSGPGNSYMQQTYRYSKIDVSNYDSIKLSGLKNGGPMSTKESRWPTISIYGDNKPIKYVDVIDGDSYILFTRDYTSYNKLEIIIMAYQSEEIYVPSVVVYKNNVFDGVFIPKRIVLCGDSIMGNESCLITLQLNSIAKAQGYEIVRHTMGGENIIGNLTRNGGIAIRVTSDFVMPTSGSVDIEVESAWMKSDGAYAQNPYNNATSRDVRIMGIKGKVTRNSTTSYTFTRNEEGESFKVGIGTLLWDEALWSCKDYPHIWFTGQNMGYENEQDWADMINMAARNFGENFIVCSTALAGTTNQLVRCATKTFGDKYINLKAYTEGQAVYDGQRFGLIDSSALASDYGSLFWPGTDKVHQNNLLSYMWAVLMWNTLLDLGYVEGDRILTAEYYKL